MKRGTFRRNLEVVWIVLVLMAWGTAPSQAYQQDLKKLATDLAARVHKMGHTRITVVDFLDLDKKPNKLGKFLTQQLQVELTEPVHQLVVVDQSQMPQLLEQIEKLTEGLIDTATGQKLGKIAGTEVLVVGTVMPSSMTIRLDIKAIDLQTAKVITGGSAGLARLGLIQRLANESLDGETATASEGGNVSVSQNSADKSPRTPARVRRDQGVLFELDGCSLSGDAMTCSVTVTSDRDRWFSISFGSRAWNESGGEFGASEGVIANSRASSSENSCTIKQILKNVPTQTSLTFAQYGNDESMVERLRLFWNDQDACWRGQHRPVDFEKIVLSDDVDFASSHTSGSSGRGRGSAEGKGKGRGGLLNRLTGKALEVLEGAATDIIEKKTRGLVGGDEGDEDNENPPK